jgi:hypothetical protein
MSGALKVMGLVQNGRLRLSVPSGRLESSVRLTRIAPQAAESPESAEIDLSEYEGVALMVTGDDQGAWIFSAEIIDKAGPILSAVVERLFGERPAGRAR